MRSFRVLGYPTAYLEVRTLSARQKGSGSNFSSDCDVCKLLDSSVNKRPVLFAFDYGG